MWLIALIIVLPPLIFNGIIFAICLSLAIFGKNLIKRKRKILGTVLLLTSITPVYIYIATLIIVDRETTARETEVASWRREPIPSGTTIRSIESLGYYPGELVSTGVVEVAHYDGKTFVQDWGKHCVSKLTGSIGIYFADAVLARNAYFSCTKKAQKESSVSPEVFIFVSKRHAPSHDKNCGTATDPLELRWPAEKGGGLISFHENPHYFEIQSPLMMNSIERPFPVECRIPERRSLSQTFQLIAMDLGISKVTDLPQKATEVELLETLRLLNVEKIPNEKAVILLLGQWPSTPAVSAFIRNEIDHDVWTYKVLKQMTDSSEILDLVPHLSSHASDFLEICPKTVRKKEYCDSFRKKLGSNS